MKANKIRIAGLMVLFTLLFTISCVQPTKKQRVEFTVDARELSDVNTISVRGSVPPLSWNQNYELEDNNHDSIYTGTIVFDIPYNFVEIKFVKNENQFELNNQPNRKVVFDESQNTHFNAKFDVLKQ